MKKPNLRATASITMLVLLVVLVVSAIMIQITDALIDPKTYISIILDPENNKPNNLIKIQHVVTAVHVVSGFLFAGVSIYHIIVNRKALKSYFNRKGEPGTGV